MKVKLSRDSVIVTSLEEVTACCDEMQYALNHGMIEFNEWHEEFMIPNCHPVRNGDVFQYKGFLKYCPFCGDKIKVIE